MDNKRPVNQVLTVPKDEEGKYFLHLLHKYLNKESYSIRLRGRTPDNALLKKDKQRPFRAFTPLKYAQNYGVYLIAKVKGKDGKVEYLTTGINEAVWNIRNRDDLRKAWVLEQRHKRVIGILEGVER